MKLGFIGLGKMGSPMARNLIRAGHELTVYNRSRAKAEPLAAEGAHLAATPGETAAGATVVFSMLPDDHAAEAAVFGKDGLAEALASGAIHISCSTISTGFARLLANLHTRRGQGYLSAPVFGRPEAAAEKKLLVVAAGPAKYIDTCRPLLEALGRQTFVAGPEAWQANAMKLCGNFMIASVLEAFGEAYATLRKAGVDPGVFLETMSTLFGSPIYANYGRAIAEGRFDPAGFALKLGLKDMRLALEVARECASPMPMASLLHDRMLSGVALGQEELDWSSVARIAAQAAGLEPPGPPVTALKNGRP